MATTDHLDDDLWNLIQDKVPIACSDVVPVRVNDHGRIVEVGLVLRDSPFEGPRWTHVGGRIRLDESAHHAAQRHLRDALRSPGGHATALIVEPEPRCFFEFFKSSRDGGGHDPRKQVLSACFLAPVTGNVVSGGEALEVGWFALDALPPEDVLWPGTSELVRRVVAHTPDAQAIAYDTLRSRAQSHNEMTWQTPALAMTAQAFLMTIALGGDTSSTARVLSALLGMLVSVLSIQLMAKHTAMHDRDVKALETLEAASGLYLVNRKQPRLAGMAGPSSRVWWQRGTWTFAVVSAAAAVFAIFWPHLLAG